VGFMRICTCTRVFLHVLYLPTWNSVEHAGTYERNFINNYIRVYFVAAINSHSKSSSFYLDLKTTFKNA